MDSVEHLSELCRRIRYDILASTSAAGSGHPTSCLSAVELMASLFFGGYLRQDLLNPHSPLNDKVIFSKGHTAPLLYSLYEAAGVVSQKELMTLRAFSSRLQGHPVPEFPYAAVATGSLGQGLSVGVGMALGTRLLITQGRLHMRREPTVWVLLGDSEMAEGQVWEAMEIASHYKLNNLVAIVDINRLGQSGETELSWNIMEYRKRAEAFGWRTLTLPNGHNLEAVSRAFRQADSLNTIHRQKPLMILAKTVKGKGVPFLEDKENWHGKAVPASLLKDALRAIGTVNFHVRGSIASPEGAVASFNPREQAVLWRLEKAMSPVPAAPVPAGTKPAPLSTREAFGVALEQAGKENAMLVALDAEVGNSTFLNKFGRLFPERYFEMFIDEENMASAALGLAKTGYTPFLSTFAAFLSRCHDQIRMMQYSLRHLRRSRKTKETEPDISINIVGSHAGVSIGQDGPSQMGLEDIAMMRSVNGATVLYPCDSVSAAALTREMTKRKGINYLRTTRANTPVVYDTSETFPVGKFKILRQGKNEQATIIAAGITVHEALKAYEMLKARGIFATVVDLYSIQPVDAEGLKKLARATRHLLVVEDHYKAGGIGEAVLSALNSGDSIPRSFQFSHLCVEKTPRSGTPAELLHYEGIDAPAILAHVLAYL